MLQVPVQVAIWILRDAYINGEPFTMNGKAMRLEKVERPPDADGGRTGESGPAAGDGGGKVISLKDLKKR